MRHPMKCLMAGLAACAFGAAPAMAVGHGTPEVASAYSPADSPGTLACTGQWFDWSIQEVASRTLPCGTPLVITYGGQSVDVTVEDRGPYVYSRQLDLSVGAVRALGVPSAVAWGVRVVQVSFGTTVAVTHRVTHRRLIRDAHMDVWRWRVVLSFVRRWYAPTYRGALWTRLTFDQPLAWKLLQRRDSLA